MPSVIDAVNRKKLSEILAEVSIETGVSVDDLRSTSKRALFVKARSFFALRAREHGYKFIDIGEAIDRCHTTAMYLIEKITPDREGARGAHGAAGVPFPVQKEAVHMDKAELKKRIAGLTKEEKKELVAEIADSGTKEDRDKLAELFSSVERERLADAPQDDAGGKPRHEVRKDPASFLDDL